MKLIIHYDPFKEQFEAQRAADAFRTLGIPVELAEQRFTRKHSDPVDEQGRALPVVFEKVSASNEKWNKLAGKGGAGCSAHEGKADGQA
jgi:hypothetical protein